MCFCFLSFSENAPKEETSDIVVKEESHPLLSALSISFSVRIILSLYLMLLVNRLEHTNVLGVLAGPLDEIGKLAAAAVQVSVEVEKRREAG